MTRWRRADVLWRRVIDGAVLMQLSGESVTLSSSGATLWELLDTPLEETTLVARAAGIYDVAPASIAPDVRAFLDDLAGQGYLVGEPQ